MKAATLESKSHTGTCNALLTEVRMYMFIRDNSLNCLYQCDHQSFEKLFYSQCIEIRAGSGMEIKEMYNSCYCGLPALQINVPLLHQSFHGNT